MSGTNAIHGIVLLGGLLLLGLAGSATLQQGAPRDRGRVRHDQHRRRLPRHRPHARDVQVQAQAGRRETAPSGAGREGRARELRRSASSFLQSESFIYVLYIVAFALFIQGLRGLAGPTTAVRGNRIAAVGMAIAVIATLLNPGEGNWGLIALGIALGAAVGVPAARQVKMTAMPQMVALFNGVGGGAVALISWVEFRHHGSTYGSHTINFAHEFERPRVRAAHHPDRGRADVRRDLLGVRRDRRLDLLLGLEHRVRQAPGNHPRAPDLASAPPSRSSTSCC